MFEQPSWRTAPYLPARDRIAAALSAAGLDPGTALNVMLAGSVAQPQYVLAIMVRDEDIDRLADFLPAPAPPASERQGAQATTVGGLIDALAAYSRDLPVVLARGEESTGFTALREVDGAMGDGGGGGWLPDLAQPSAVVLWP